MREGVLLDAVSIPLETNGQTSWPIDQAFPSTDTSDFVGSVRCSAGGVCLPPWPWKWTPAPVPLRDCRW